MEIEIYDRDNPLQKKRLIQSAHDRGLSTLHDDYISDTQGKLFFNVRPIPVERVIKSIDELNLLLFKKRISYIELLDLLTLQAISPTRWESFKARFGL